MKNKKILFLFVCILLNFKAFSQEVFIGKIEYVKEVLSLSGVFIPKANGESITYFNSQAYSFSQTNTLNIEEQVEKLIKTMPKNANITDSFELARQKEMIKKQLLQQLGNSNNTLSFINYSNNISKKPRKVGNENYCVIDTLGTLGIELKQDTLTLEGLLCQKAIVNFAGKYFTVWFTLSIPFPAGPLNMHGLPGVIILATSEDGKLRYRMKKIDYPLNQPVKLMICENCKEITSLQFMEIQSDRREILKGQIESYKQSLNKNN